MPLRGLLAAAMALALLVRIAVPVGFMPTAIADTVVILLCEGNGGQSVAIDLGNKAPEQKHEAADSPCVFAGGFAGGVLMPFAPVMPVPDLASTASDLSAAIADLVVHRLAAPPPPAQAPPARP